MKLAANSCLIDPEYSPEADKLLDWIVSARCTNRHRPHSTTPLVLFRQDVGVLEAVEKQYLKACVFAVYLVSIPGRKVFFHLSDPLVRLDRIRKIQQSKPI